MALITADDTTDTADETGITADSGISVSTREAFFFALELDVYQPATGTTQPYAYGHGSHPHGAITMLASSPGGNTSTTLRASDLGYRSKSTDSIGVQVYPPVMEQAFSIDRHLALEPGRASTSTFGSVQLFNLGQRYDSFVQGRNCDSRSAKLLLGQKVRDASRGILIDPSYAALAPFFGGFAKSWQLSEELLEIPLTDATYWADRPLQSNFYSGSGGLQGTPALAGLPMPVARGGTLSAPIQNVPLVNVDPVNLVYQWTDGPGTIAALYEGGAAVFAYDGDVSDLYGGTPPIPGHFRTNNARGVLQMGSQPVRALTADVTGKFVTAGPVTTAAAIARYVLTETMAQPTSLIDTASFSTLDTNYPYQAGFWIGVQTVSGLEIVQTLLGSVGARMISGRDGRVKAVALRPLSAAEFSSPSIAFTTRNAVSVSPQPLPTTLDPPPYRWRIGYNQNYNVQSSDFEGVITEARKAFLAQQYTLASWSSSTVLTSYLRPKDPDVVGTYLLSAGDATVLASAYGALWMGRPDLYSVEVPMDVAQQVDIGTICSLTWPLGALKTGRVCQIVGEQIRSYDGTCVFTVLEATT
jgi:hypothetical protein